MKKFSAKRISFDKNIVLDIFKSSLIALIIALIGVLVLGLCVKLFNMAGKVTMPILQVVKIISILGGCLMGFKQKAKGALKGGVSGVLFTLISVLVFGLIENTVSFKAFNWFDLIAGLAAGVICGIIAVNLGKKKFA